MLRRNRGLHAVHGTESTRWPAVVPAGPDESLRGTEIRNVTSESPLGSSITVGAPLSRPTSRTSLATTSRSLGSFVCVFTVHLLRPTLPVATDSRAQQRTVAVDNPN